MKRFAWIAIVALAATLLPLGAASVLAANEICDSLSGSAGNGECVVNTPHTVSGTIAIDRTLRITTGGSLTVVPPNSLTLNIAGSAVAGLLIENGGKISGNTVSGTGAGALITINVASGNVVLAASGASITSDNAKGLGCGAGGIAGRIDINATGLNAEIITEDGTLISASGTDNAGGLGTCSAGAINITATNKGKIDIDGDVLSRSGTSGGGIGANFAVDPAQGRTQKPGGGPIFITASCDLTVSDTGTVSSFGLDPGADLVHLQGGCDVLINGLVESTGHGHVIPGSPPNSCSDVIPSAGFVRRNPATRPDKDPHSTGCVEVWAGNSLTINRDYSGLSPIRGEINADIGNGGQQGTSWIDLFARGDITILNNDTTMPGTFTVHANELAGTKSPNTLSKGGDVTVKSRDGAVTTTGLALQAEGPGCNGCDGGNIVVESGGVAAGGAGDIAFGTATVDAVGDGLPGAVGIGGTITAKSHNAQITGALPGILDTREGGTTGGVITLTACTADPAASYAGTRDAGTNNSNFPDCGTPVTFEAYVVLPDCPCEETPGEPCEKAAVKSVLNPLTGRFPGNLGPDVIVRLDLGQTVQDAVDNVVASNADPYLIILVVKDGTGVLGGHTTENVDISKAYDLRFALIGCSVAIRADDASLPAGHIEPSASSPAGSAENIFVMDLHGTESNAEGWLVEGDGRYMRNVDNEDNGTGIAFVGDDNVMHNGNATDNAGVGMTITGNGNTAMDTDLFGNGGAGAIVTGGDNVLSKLDVGDRGKGNGSGVGVSGDDNQVLELDVFSNAGDGIVVTGNGNTIKKNDVGERGKGNAGDGIRVVGSGNQIVENEALASNGDGFDVDGGTGLAPNVLKKNKAGDRDQGNLGNGFALGAGDVGNGTANPIELEENTAIANTLNGFAVAGTGHTLKKNVSGNSGTGYDNGDCEYLVAAGNFNGTGNKANNVAIAGANNTAFPTACIGTP